MPDYRSPLMKQYDEMVDTPQSVIDAHNAGVEFMWHVVDNQLGPDDVDDSELPYQNGDRSDEAIAFWTGFTAEGLEQLRTQRELSLLDDPGA